MAKYEINYSCGHTAWADLIGSNADRQKKIAYYERSGECPACYAARIAAHRDRLIAPTLAAYESYRAEHGVADLIGSDKQVAWAEDIRARVIGTLLRIKEQAPAEDAGAFDARIEEIAVISKAHDIIDAWSGAKITGDLRDDTFEIKTVYQRRAN